MKKFYFLKTMLAVMLTMLLTIGNVFADRGWVQVTYNSNLSVGDTVIIAALTYDKAMGAQNNNNRAAVDVIKTSDGGMITSIGSRRFGLVSDGLYFLSRHFQSVKESRFIMLRLDQVERRGLEGRLPRRD